MGRKPFKGIPQLAIEFLRVKPKAAVSVRKFHQWLKSTHLPILALTPVKIEHFLRRLAQERVCQNTRCNHRSWALAYFDWLFTQQLLSFDPQVAWPRCVFPLPSEAERFLQTLKPTHKRSTVRGYQCSLRQFHIWLNSQSVPLAQIERTHIAAWLQWLHSRGLQPSSRTGAIKDVRSYLIWLQEQGLLTAQAELLIRRADFPKLPEYLPRPLAPDLDTELQRRFKKSRCNYQLGLLLMRHTGLRIGELMSLPYDCIRRDPKGNTLLKVPLGKLDNERLVPLDAKTTKLVVRLRRQTPRKRPFLLQTPHGQRTRYHHYTRALADACTGLSFSEPMTTHRLRHTYATSLLGGGMNLVSVMRLLGHRDVRMTLRYAAITDETVLTEYTQALKHTEQRYKPPVPAPDVASSSHPTRLLSDVVRHLQKRVQDDGLDKTNAKILIRRLWRLRAAITKLLRSRG